MVDGVNSQNSIAGRPLVLQTPMGDITATPAGNGKVNIKAPDGSTAQVTDAEFKALMQEIAGNSNLTGPSQDTFQKQNKGGSPLLGAIVTGGVVGGAAGGLTYWFQNPIGKNGKAVEGFFEAVEKVGLEKSFDELKVLTQKGVLYQAGISEEAINGLKPEELEKQYKAISEYVKGETKYADLSDDIKKLVPSSLEKTDNFKATIKNADNFISSKTEYLKSSTVAEMTNSANKNRAIATELEKIAKKSGDEQIGALKKLISDNPKEFSIVGDTVDDIAKNIDKTAKEMISAKTIDANMNIFKEGADCLDEAVSTSKKTIDEIIAKGGNNMADFKKFIKSGDETAKAVTNASDDAAKAIASATDDVAKEAAKKAGDVAKEAAQETDDAVKILSKATKNFKLKNALKVGGWVGGILAGVTLVLAGISKMSQKQSHM